MKITDVKTEVVHIPLKKPFRIAFAVQDHSVNVLVKIMTDDGLWGIGEAAPFEPVTGENAGTVLEVLKLFRQGLIGRDALDIEGAHRMMDGLIAGNTAAKAAVDIALYDLRGKAMGQPLYKVLGGGKNQFVTDMTVGIADPDIRALHPAFGRFETRAFCYIYRRDLSGNKNFAVFLIYGKDRPHYRSHLFAIFHDLALKVLGIVYADLCKIGFFVQAKY